MHGRHVLINTIGKKPLKNIFSTSLKLLIPNSYAKTLQDVLAQKCLKEADVTLAEDDYSDFELRLGGDGEIAIGFAGLHQPNIIGLYKLYLIHGFFDVLFALNRYHVFLLAILELREFESLAMLRSL